jgi:hypothetical protein
MNLLPTDRIYVTHVGGTMSAFEPHEVVLLSRAEGLDAHDTLGQSVELLSDYARLVEGIDKIVEDYFPSMTAGDYDRLTALRATLQMACEDGASDRFKVTRTATVGEITVTTSAPTAGEVVAVINGCDPLTVDYDEPEAPAKPSELHQAATFTFGIMACLAAICAGAVFGHLLNAY